MKESYVSYEIACKLKECGFGWEATGKYVDFPDNPILFSGMYYQPRNLMEDEIIAPTMALAQKWLREVKGIIVWVSPEFYEGEALNDVRWHFHAQPLSNLRKAIGGRGYVFYSYESVLSAGISAALTLLTEKQ